MLNTDRMDCNNKGWIEIQLVDESGNGKPYEGLGLEFVFADGSYKKESLDDKGVIRFEKVACGRVSIKFDELYSEKTCPVKLDAPLKSLYQKLIEEGVPITNLQVMAEQTSSSNKSINSQFFQDKNIQNTAVFRNVQVYDLVDKKQNLPNIVTWKSSHLIQRNLEQINQEYKKKNEEKKDNSWNETKAKILQQERESTKQKTDKGIDVRPKQRVELENKKRELESNSTNNKYNITNLIKNSDFFETGKKYILRIKSLRAYRPLLSTSNKLCALNLYQLAILSALSYRDFDTPPTKSIKSLFTYWEEHIPMEYTENGQNFSVFLEDVPYSKRFQLYNKYTNFIFDKETNTQIFITHHDKVLLISIRGTKPDPSFDERKAIMDIVTDLNIPQTTFEEFPSAKLHTGFYEAFKSVKAMVEIYLEKYVVGVDKIIITGHSLGGAVATILATWIYKTKDYANKVLLYTYGSPRVGDTAFVKLTTEVSDDEIQRKFPHHRIVNNLDTVPYIPFPWLKDESLTRFFLGAAFDELRKKLTKPNLPYTHHGKMHHIIPIDTTINKSFLSGLFETGITSPELSDEDGLPKSRPGIFFSSPTNHTIKEYINCTLNIFNRWRQSYLNKTLMVTENDFQKIKEGIKIKAKTLNEKEDNNATRFIRNMPVLDDYSLDEARVQYNEACASIIRVNAYNETATGKNLYGDDIFTQFNYGKGPLPLQEIVNRWGKIK